MSGVYVVSYLVQWTYCKEFSHYLGTPISVLRQGRPDRIIRGSLMLTSDTGMYDERFEKNEQFVIDTSSQYCRLQCVGRRSGQVWRKRWRHHAASLHLPPGPGIAEFHHATIPSPGLLTAAYA
jgi:hypothetical protein